MAAFFVFICSRRATRKRTRQPAKAASSVSDENRSVLFRCNDHLFPWKLREEVFADRYMLVDQAGGSVGHPLCEGDVLVERRRKDLDEYQIGVPCVLDEVGHRFIDVTYVACLEVHGASVAAG